MLYNLSLEEDTSRFCSEYLQNLLDYDNENNSAYMETFKTIVKND